LELESAVLKFLTLESELESHKKSRTLHPCCTGCNLWCTYNTQTPATANPGAM